MVTLRMTVPSNTGHLVATQISFMGTLLNLRSWSTTSVLGEIHTSQLTEMTLLFQLGTTTSYHAGPVSSEASWKEKNTEIKKKKSGPSDLRELLIQANCPLSVSSAAIFWSTLFKSPTWAEPIQLFPHGYFFFSTLQQLSCCTAAFFFNTLDASQVLQVTRVLPSLLCLHCLGTSLVHKVVR